MSEPLRTMPCPECGCKPGPNQVGSHGETDESGRMHWRWADDAGPGRETSVIRQAALHFLHGEDVSDAPASLSLAALADALGVPHEDVEAL